MKEANQKQTRVQVSAINNEKISVWVFSLESSDNSRGEKMLVGYRILFSHTKGATM